MTEIMPVPRNLILLSYQQRAFRRSLFIALLHNIVRQKHRIKYFFRQQRYGVSGVSARARRLAAKTRSWMAMP